MVIKSLVHLGMKAHSYTTVNCLTGTSPLRNYGEGEIAVSKHISNILLLNPAVLMMQPASENEQDTMEVRT